MANKGRRSYLKRFLARRELIYLILAVSVLLRLSRMNESLWLDELWSTNFFLGAGQFFHTVLRNNLHPPFHSVFMFFWIWLFGDSEISIRIPAFLFGIGSIFLAYTLVLRFVDRKTALLTSLLLCLSPVHIWYSQESRPYAGIMFFVLLSIFSYQRLKQPEAGRSWYVVYFLSIASAALSHFYVFFYLVAQSLVCLLGKGYNTVKRNILVLNGVAVLLFGLFCALKFRAGMPSPGSVTYLRPFTFFELWMLLFDWFLYGNSLWNIWPYDMHPGIILKAPLLFYTQMFFLVIFIHGLIINLRQSRRSFGLEIAFYLFFTPLALVALSYIGFKHLYMERSLFFILPFFYIILARGAVGFKSKPLSAALTLTIVLFSLAALYGFYNKSGQWTVYKPKPDWRSVTRYFEDEAEGNSQRFFVFATVQADELIYYLERKEMYPQRVELHNYASGDIGKKMAAENIRTFYLLKNTFWPAYFDSLLKETMDDPGFEYLGETSFRSIEIFKFRVM